jgi:hypothetical protein
MIQPTKYDFELPQGSTWDDVWTLKVAGTPYNLTGCTARLQFRKAPTSPTAALSITSSSGITLGGSAGTVTFNVADTVTAAIDAGIYVYDLEVETAGGVTSRWVYGKVNLSAEVTK